MRAAPDPGAADPRPGTITVIAVLTGAGGLFGLLEVALAGGFLALAPVPLMAQSWVSLLVLFEGLDAVLSLVCAVGLWRMRRWSVVLYGGLVAFNAGVGALLGPRSAGSPFPAS